MAINTRKTKKGDVRYQVRVQDAEGCWFEAKTFSRKVDAENYERSLLNRKDTGEGASRKDVRDLTVEAYIEQKWKKDCRSRVSEGWRMTQDQMLRDYILPIIGKRRILEVKSDEVGQVLRRMEELGRGGQTRRHVYNILHHIFDAACNYHQVISRSPLLKRDKPEVLEVIRTVLKPEQAKKLLLHSRRTPMGPAIWLGILAAIRPNEIQALKWNAVDLDLGVIFIRCGFKRKTGKIDPYPKQKRHGQVVIPPPLKNFLVELAKGKGPEDFVAAGIDHEMLSYTTFLKNLKEQCRELGIPIVTPHELRHSCTELWVEQGASEEDIVRLLNHSGSGAVRRYMHKTNERLVRIAQGISVDTEPQVTRPALRLVKS